MCDRGRGNKSGATGWNKIFGGAIWWILLFGNFHRSISVADKLKIVKFMALYENIQMDDQHACIFLQQDQSAYLFSKQFWTPVVAKLQSQHRPDL